MCVKAKCVPPFVFSHFPNNEPAGEQLAFKSLEARNCNKAAFIRKRALLFGEIGTKIPPPGRDKNR